VKNPGGVKTFGIQLRRLRESKDLSQQELANLADLAKITIQRIENAKYSVTIDTLISLAQGLNLPLRELTDFTIPKEKGK
jgi:transcriptional regulator with XRE-family HTH domain